MVAGRCPVSIRVYQATVAPEKLRVRLNPGSSRPFAVIELDEYGRGYIAVDTIAIADELIRAAIEARRLLLGERDDAPADAAAQLEEIRAVLTAFDWATDDRRFALEEIESILNGDGPVSASEDLSIGLAEQAQLIQWHVGVWHDLGYPEPLPSPDAHPIPPLGERPAAAIKGGHDAIRDIDELTRQLYALREQLVSELRQDEDIRTARLDAMLADRKARREGER
jgi:hypothetical protein